MGDSYLRERLDTLLERQNADGGWGYVPGKQSWTEPTAYAMLALEGEPGANEALEKAWKLLRSWQFADGGWRPSADIEQSSWVTALAVTLHCARGAEDQGFLDGVGWLLETRGAEGSWLNRLFYNLGSRTIDSNPSLQGWPWLPGTGSWVEPTSHALVALRHAARPLRDSGFPKYKQLTARVRLAERMIEQRRAVDGGWNYGNRTVLGEELPSCPESTGLALLGMQGCPDFDAGGAIDVARRQIEETRSPLARAWLAIGLRIYGIALSEAVIRAEELSVYTHVTALEVLSAHPDRYRLLAAKGVA